MSSILGIRREDKNKWEKRVPIIPEHIKKLKDEHGIETIIQPSSIRTFSDDKYDQVGAKIDEKLSSNVIFAIKEIPEDFFEAKKTYIFFSHTIKGQKYNMHLLKKMMQLKCNLIDYEKITNEKGQRLIFFGKYAGNAGMIDTLWAFGQRLKWKGFDTPFSQIKQTIDYMDLDDAKNHISQIADIIQKEGLPSSISPVVVGFAGYGNVSKGAQEIFDILPFEQISPDQLKNICEGDSSHLIYKVEFKEKDMVVPMSPQNYFDLQQYYESPDLYRSVFQDYVPKLSILMNCIYWTKKYPRLITKDFIKKSWTKHKKLEIIGDISVDVNGAIEFTEKVTTPDNPVFIYNPSNCQIMDGYKGEGIVVLAVDNLPCEIPKESSIAFSNSLIDFIPNIVKADYSVDFNDLDLRLEIKKAVILYHGELTEDYKYMNKFL